MVPKFEIGQLISITKHSIGQQFFDPHKPEVELADLKHRGYKFSHSKPNFEDLDEGHFDQHHRENRGCIIHTFTQF